METDHSRVILGPSCATHAEYRYVFFAESFNFLVIEGIKAQAKGSVNLVEAT